MAGDDRSTQSERFLAGESIHERWESDYLGSALEPFYEDAFDWLVAGLGARPGDEVLDAGCGYCLHAARLARRGLRVTGVDFSASALEQARRQLESQGLADRVTLRQGDLLALPFDDASFDHATCWGVLMHVPEVERALAELVRVLRPGGRLALAENNADSLHVRVWEPALRGLKRVLGRGGPTLAWGPRGQEEWHDGEGGGLLVRKTRIPWLVSQLDGLGARLVRRGAGQFSEIYTSLPAGPLQSAVHGFNRWWLREVGWAGPALGNLLIFEKH